MLAALEAERMQHDFADQHGTGMRHWTEQTTLEPVSAWMLARSARKDHVCWSIVSAHRESLQELVNRP
jgi:hypothetical protein